MNIVNKIIINLLVSLSLVPTSLAWSRENKAQFVVEKSPVIAFTNARLIDGTGAQEKDNHTVLIREGRIVALGPDGAIDIPTVAKEISLLGKSLLPGWVMHHEHLYYAAGNHDPELYLSGGVTTARTAGTHRPYADIRIKDAIDTGALIGPTFHLTAPFLEGQPGTFLSMHLLDGPNEAREMVRYWAGQGFTSFKVYKNITRAQFSAAADEAHRLGLKITGHLCSLTYREAAELGIDQIEHGFIVASDFFPDKKSNECPTALDALNQLSKIDPNDDIVKDLFSYLIDKKVSVTSTLVTSARMANMLPPLPDEIAALFDESSRARYENYVASMTEKNTDIATLREAQKVAMSLELAFWRAGGKLVLGSDPAVVGVLPGHANLNAVELLVDVGIPPLEAIKIATLNGAEVLGVANDVGTIAIGKRADLIIIDGNPAENIHDIHNIDTVFKNGVGYDPDALRRNNLGMVHLRR